MFLFLVVIIIITFSIIAKTITIHSLVVYLIVVLPYLYAFFNNSLGKHGTLGDIYRNTKTRSNLYEICTQEIMKYTNNVRRLLPNEVTRDSSTKKTTTTYGRKTLTRPTINNTLLRIIATVRNDVPKTVIIVIIISRAASVADVETKTRAIARQVN